MKPSLPKGTRDYNPDQVYKRNFIFDTLRHVFEKFGYEPIETPVMENLSTLTGKYGDEGDQLLFKVLNNGDFLRNADKEDLKNRDYKKLAFSICKRGLRYDLTVPFARYVVMHRNEITFPFKRYQMQPVWRGDRPQKGRYQEFYQCDVDVVGSDALINEVELTQMYDEGFARLGIDCIIRLNNRKILTGMAEAASIPELITEMTTAIDKLDKIGMDGVKKEMKERGIPDSAIEKIETILGIEKITDLKPHLSSSKTGMEGLVEMETVFSYLERVDLKNQVLFDVKLARGLSYYTGIIFEVHSTKVDIGSIGGGGRYDNLTGVFGMEGVPGVGVSFGLDRMFDVMEELNLFPASTSKGSRLIFLTFDHLSFDYAFDALQSLRSEGIPCEIYPETAKFKKQIKYANDRNIPFAAIVGDNEVKAGKYMLKNMKSGDQRLVTLQELSDHIKEHHR